jgi:hypothetical protein
MRTEVIEKTYAVYDELSKEQQRKEIKKHLKLLKQKPETFLEEYFRFAKIYFLVTERYLSISNDLSKQVIEQENRNKNKIKKIG